MSYLANLMSPYLPLLTKNNIPKKFIIDAIYIYRSLYKPQKKMGHEHVFLFAVKLAILHYEETRAIETATKKKFQTLIYNSIDNFIINNQIAIEKDVITHLTSDSNIFIDANKICAGKIISCSKKDKEINETIFKELVERFGMPKIPKTIPELIERIRLPYNPSYLLYFKALEMNALPENPQEKNTEIIEKMRHYIREWLSETQIKTILNAYTNSDKLEQTSVFRIVKAMSERVETLFSHTKNNEIIYFANGGKMKSEGAFHAILSAIQDAKSHIMITGWAIDLKETLGGNIPLGELLVGAVKRGVNVFIMPWQQSRLLKKGHEAQGFYNDVKNMPAYLLHLMKTLDVSEKNQRKLHVKIISCHDLTASNHQKMVIVDNNEGTKLFAGGLDLTYGRSDTAKHMMRNKQNWHDCHLQIMGPLASDAIRLYMGMWRAQPIKNLILSMAGDSHAKKSLWQAYLATENFYLEQKNISEATVKLCCSITGPSYNHLFEAINEKNSKENVVSSIKNAYRHAIESAQNFIYMENQFFIGDYFNKYGKLHNSVNSIPKLIAEKIIERHKQGADFMFMCVLPFRPEGDADDFSVQTILRKQWKTMAWLIEHVNYQTEDNAYKYIRFINIGHTVVKEGKAEYQDIYVHSKLMIVDDEKVILGSANINERSMCGKKDTEVACYIDTNGDKKEIKNTLEYRTRLMHEHFGKDFHKDLINQLHLEKTRIEIDKRIAVNLFQLKRNSLNFNLDSIPFDYLLVKPLKTAVNDTKIAEVFQSQVIYMIEVEKIAKNSEITNIEKLWQLHLLSFNDESLKETKLGRELLSIYENFSKLLSSVSLFASIFWIARDLLKLNTKGIQKSLEIIAEKKFTTEIELYNFLIDMQKIEFNQDNDGKKIEIVNIFLEEIKKHIEMYKLKEILETTAKYGFATSWGNIPPEQLYQSPPVRPEHVPRKTPLKGIVVDKVVTKFTESMFK